MRATTPAVRRRVVEAALEAFTTHGYDAVSVSMIREGAGVSVGSLYHHFESKAGVASAVFAEAIDRYHRPLLDIVATRPPAETGIRSLVEAHHLWVARHTDWARFMMTMGDLPEVRADAVRRDAANTRFFEALQDWARPLMDRGMLLRLDPLVFSSVLFGPSYFATRRSLDASVAPPNPDVAVSYADAAWKSLAGPSATDRHDKGA